MFITRRKHKREIAKLQDAIRVTSLDASRLNKALFDSLAESEQDLRRAKDLIYRSEKTNGSR